jgi:hypothetical protein
MQMQTKALQRSGKTQPYAATLVSLAALGADKARFVIQLPEDGLHSKGEHFRDAMTAATRLHTDTKGREKVVQVDAIQALSDAKVQCAVNPGVSELFSACCIFCHQAARGWAAQQSGALSRSNDLCRSPPHQNQRTQESGAGRCDLGPSDVKV